MTSPSDLLTHVINAHGGMDLWKQIASLTLDLEFGGILPASRFRRPGMRRARVTVEPDTDTVHMDPWGSPDTVGLMRDDRLILLDRDGNPLQERQVRRREDGRVIRRLFWDDLDELYFWAYAFLNYTQTPFLFARPGFDVQPLDPVQTRDGRRHRLRVVHPKGFPTHSRIQTFYFGDDGILRRLDYHAEVFGPMARGAYHVSSPITVDGWVVPTRREVFPLLPGGRYVPGIRVVHGWIRNVEIQFRSE